MSGKLSMPKVKIVAGVHSRVHYCREGALVQLTGGLDRLISRNGGKEAAHSSLYTRYALCLGEELLADVNLGKICTLGSILHAGYGNGLMNEVACQAASEQVNEPFQDLSAAVQRMAPLLGLLASGLYLVADCELQPVYRSWGDPHHCLHEPVLSCDEAKAFDGSRTWDIPFYFLPIQRASVLNPDRVRHYMEQMQQASWRASRAIALYLNGSFSLLLDGHHKAAAAAALGTGLRTLMIFPLQNGKIAEAAIRSGKKLELCQGRWSYEKDSMDARGGSLYLADADFRKITGVRTLGDTVPKEEAVSIREKTDWGRVPECFCCKMDQYPSSRLLHEGTAIPPDRIKSVMRSLMETPWPIPSNKDCTQSPYPELWVKRLRSLSAFAKLFPDSPMLTEQQRHWLERTEQAAKEALGRLY